MYIKLKKSRWC